MNVIDYIRNSEDGSIVDPKLILLIVRHNDASLFRKIKPEYQIAGLYPNQAERLNINPETK